MQARLSRSLAILTPPFLGITAIGYAIFEISKGPFKGSSVELDVGIFSFPIPSDTTHFIVIFLLGVLLIYYTLSRDYSYVLPDKLSFDVYFDTSGMHTILSTHHAKSKAGITVSDQWMEKTKSFHAKLSRDIRRKMNIAIDFDQIEEVSARGITTFCVEKLDRGFQNYQIIEIDGYLHFDIPLKSSITSMKSFFALNGTSRSRFTVSVKNLLIDHTFVLSPLMRQTYISGHDQEIVLENVIALTQIRFFPYVDIGDTLYLTKDGSEYIPMGYCSYRQ